MSFRLSERSAVTGAKGEISLLRSGIAIEQGRFFDSVPKIGTPLRVMSKMMASKTKVIGSQTLTLK
jgi:hypothetical protein